MRWFHALPLALLISPAWAAPAGGDLDRAALRVAGVLDGVVRNCPDNFAQIGTSQKKCVGVGITVEASRVKLGAALGADLFGVWRSRDEQRSVFNWLRVGQDHVFVRLQPDPEGRAQTLVYLDVPPAAPPAPAAPATSGTGATQIGIVVLTPVQPVGPSIIQAMPGGTPQPADTAVAPASATLPMSPDAAPPDGVPAPDHLAPVPFSRTLQLQDRRLNGPDVLAVQNRLIALMRPLRVGQGDGWYGPVTATTVRVFQRANGLNPTGEVDRPTWDRLFSGEATPFDAPVLP
ncbi:peptidoglycan-binding domain-containing protein [Deinococcus aerophilus]|uniref:Peptidoglycan binding-like domain-containing protein n=1 Tax=Deinococcus aerophilus TaxID=522488 RepID=A0ABQ2GSG5_9DEIO|nr:peptidoglycan-binding protein [Deinococcus aerophilus]GGM09739.1 hypothetical protein GCM10010841_17700 [Deinococcus aerophilus]